MIAKRNPAATCSSRVTVPEIDSVEATGPATRFCPSNNRLVADFPRVLDWRGAADIGAAIAYRSWEGWKTPFHYRGGGGGGNGGGRTTIGECLRVLKDSGGGCPCFRGKCLSLPLLYIFFSVFFPAFRKWEEPRLSPFLPHVASLKYFFVWMQTPSLCRIYGTRYRLLAHHILLSILMEALSNKLSAICRSLRRSESDSWI